MVKKLCKACKTEFEVRNYRKHTALFCSRKCKSISQVGNVKPNSGQFKKGHISTNGFKKGHIPWTKGKKLLYMTREKNPRWNGGKALTGNGYVGLLIPNHPFSNKRGYVYEHRIIMEKKLGRYLETNEVVHHINGIKTDNRPKNLKLFIDTGKHSKLHDHRDKRTGRFI